MTHLLGNIMNISPFTLLLLLLQFILFTINVNAQNFPDGRGGGAAIPSRDSVSNFQPSLAVVIGMLAIMFFLTFLLLLYAKFCHRPASPLLVPGRRNIRDGLARSSSSLTSGVDKTVVQSLPFFRFCSLRGSREGLECSVCLSKFEDVEILRLLPKCKHAFHIDCIDQWLEKHATCPLCRRNVTADDVSQMTYSSSLRFLWDPAEAAGEESGTVELFVQREDNNRSSSRFSVGSSFRKITEKNEEELPIRDETDVGRHSSDDDNDGGRRNIVLHKFNHRIVVSDVVFKNRWSNVSSSDLVFLNSEMISDLSSSRFLDSGNRSEQKFNIDDRQMMNIKEEMERKRVFESKVREIRAAVDGDRSSGGLPAGSDSGFGRKELNQNEKRSMSEIVVHPRFGDSSVVAEFSDVKEERRRRIWLPIARKTVRWFANRERRELPQSRGLNLQRLNV